MRKKITNILCLILFVSLFACEVNIQSADQQMDYFDRFIVNLTTQVADVEGREEKPIPDGVQVNTELTATNVLIVLDSSGSMDGLAMEQAKSAVQQFVDGLATDINVGMQVFPSRKVVVPLGINNREEIRTKLDKVTGAGGTPLYRTMGDAYEELLDQVVRQNTYGAFFLIVVTDGRSGEYIDGNELVLQIVNNSPVEIHTIGFNFDDTHPLNMEGVVNYTTANDTETLLTRLEGVAAELVAYDPDNVDYTE